MGPLLFRAEDFMVPGWSELSTKASMGPLLFRAEDVLTVDDLVDTEVAGFNGAALVQSGRPDDRSCAATIADLLQWGRSCSERKTQMMALGFFEEPECFNGAALVQSGRRLSGLRVKHPREASMGPLLFRAEDGLSPRCTSVL